MSSSFREFVDDLRTAGELVEVTKPVDIRHIATLVDQSDKALLFTNVEGYDMPVVSGLINSRERLAIAMGCGFGEIEGEGQRPDSIAGKLITMAAVVEQCVRQARAAAANQAVEVGHFRRDTVRFANLDGKRGAGEFVRPQGVAGDFDIGDFRTRHGDWRGIAVATGSAGGTFCCSATRPATATAGSRQQCHQHKTEPAG